MAYATEIPYKRCAIFIGVYGSLQAIIWLGVTLMFAISTLAHSSKVVYANRHYKKKNIYWETFQDTHLNIKSSNATFMLLYSIIFAIISILWLLASLNLVYKIFKNEHPRQPYVIWALLTLGICVADAIIACIVINDVVRLANERANPNSKMNKIAKAYTKYDPYDVRLSVVLGLFVLAARGFILWIINLICAILLLMAQHTPEGKKIMRSEQTYEKRKKKKEIKEVEVSPVQPPPCSPLCTIAPSPVYTCKAAPPHPPMITLNMIKEMFVCSGGPDDTSSQATVKSAKGSSKGSKSTKSDKGSKGAKKKK